MTTTTPRIAAIALRPKRYEPLVPVEAANAVEGRGLDGDHTTSANRGITLVSAEQWKATETELGMSLPWTMRRANLLIEGVGSMEDWVGQRVAIGGIEVEVTGITHPCERMEQAQPGLLKALGPDGRGGLLVKILKGGTINVGDTVELVTASTAT